MNPIIIYSIISEPNKPTRCEEHYITTSARKADFYFKVVQHMYPQRLVQRFQEPFVERYVKPVREVKHAKP